MPDDPGFKATHPDPPKRDWKQLDKLFGTTVDRFNNAPLRVNKAIFYNESSTIEISIGPNNSANAYPVPVKGSYVIQDELGVDLFDWWGKAASGTAQARIVYV